MRVVAYFNFGGSEFQVAHLESLGRVQLWWRSTTWTDHTWEAGHAKDIPQGMTAGDVAAAMQRFVNGDITHEEYQRLLP